MIYTMENIQKEITETVNEYLNNGYLLEFSNYSSNVEKCHFFVRKNRTFVDSRRFVSWSAPFAWA